MEEVLEEEEEFESSLSSSQNEEDDILEADVEEEPANEEQPILWSACNDRGSNVVKGMNSLFEDDEEVEKGEIDVPCDANNCVCHLCKGAVDALLGGRFKSALFAKDCTLILGVSSAMQGKGEGRGLLQEVATVETSHLAPLRKGDTRWEGLHQCWGRAIKMKEAWQGFFEDKEAGQQCLEKAGIKFSTDFPEDNFWERGEFYYELLTKVHTFSKWAQLERQPNMMFLVEKVASLVNYFALQDGEVEWKKQCRKSFRKSLQQLVMDRVLGGDTPFAVRAALFNPLIDITAFVTPNIVSLCEETVVTEIANFFPAIEKAEYDESSLKRILSLAWEQFKVSKQQFAKKLPQILSGRQLKEVPFPEKVEILREFWARPKHPFPMHLVYACRAYWSAPVASSKSESTFSYSGEVITKKRNKLSVHLSEAMTVGYDWTRQEHFKFETFVKGVFGLDEEYAKLKEKEKSSKETERRALKKRLRELNECE
jgi:hypothetical protein